MIIDDLYTIGNNHGIVKLLDARTTVVVRRFAKSIVLRLVIGSDVREEDLAAINRDYSDVRDSNIGHH